MLIDFLNWISILFEAYMIGFGILKPVRRYYCAEDTAARIAAGTVALTVFCECLSIFGGIGMPAFLVSAVASILIFIRFHGEILEKRRLRSNSSLWSRLLILLLFFFFLVKSALQPASYDDYLYHAQALEWIERYGAVPGLGNLHFRFAYNSSFLCLQALFSWKWLVGQSLHTVNALYAFLLSAHCVSSISFLNHSGNLPVPAKANHKEGFSALCEPVLTSDLLKCVALVYLFYDTSVLSGLDTDPLAMMTVIFVFIRWAELAERHENSGMPYALLSLLAVYACTLKLSCGAMALLALYPLYIFIRGRQGHKIGLCVAAGVVILLPYLIRNVIISGYLLYPMNAIDLFPVDWKMPVYKLVEDRQGIQIWGRSLNGLLSEGKSWVEVAAMPFTEWFPTWFRSISHIQQLLFILACAAAVDFLFHMALHLFRRTKPDGQEFLLFVGICCFAFWLFSAPLIRYGSLYMMIVAGCWIGVYHNKVSRALLYLWMVLLAVELSHLPAGSLLRPADYYKMDEMTESEVSAQDGSTVTIYVPASGDQTDYQHFPSAPSAGDLKGIALRGNAIKDGFRVKDIDG